MHARLFSPLDGHNWSNSGKKGGLLRNKSPQQSNSTTLPSNHADPPKPAPSSTIWPKKKGVIGCPGLTTYCFPQMHWVRFNTLIRCDKFNEPVSEEDKLVRLWFPSQTHRGNLWTADSCQPHSSSSSQLNINANKAMAVWGGGDMKGPKWKCKWLVGKIPTTTTAAKIKMQF